MARHAPLPPTVWGTDLPWSELRIAIFYLFVAAIWVVSSDRTLEWLEDDPPEPVSLQTFKGINFVVISALVFFLILRRGYLRRRAAEVRANEEADRFEIAARTSADVIWDWNLKSGVIWATLHPDFRRDDDWNVEGLGLGAFRRVIHPTDVDRVVGGLQELAEQRRQTWSDEFQIRKRDGVYATVMGRSSLVRGEGDVPLRVVGALTDITRRREAEKQLFESHGRLRALAARLQTLREEERVLIARELHDDLGQALTALKLALRPVESGLESFPDPVVANPLIDRIVEAGALADDAIAATQRISANLRPPALESLGLSLALQQEARAFQERAEIPCRLTVLDGELPLNGEGSLALYRIFQEALTNIARHAQAAQVVANLRREGGYAELAIRDDGVGLPQDSLGDPRSLGLLGMRERAFGAGGDVVFAPVQPHGTAVTVRIPLFEPLQPGPSP